MSTARAVTGFIYDEVVLSEAECREIFQEREEDTVPEGVPLYLVEELGSTPQYVHDSVTAQVALSCPGCGRGDGQVVARGAKSEFQMGVRWAVDQLRRFLEGHMSRDQAQAVAKRFSGVVVED